MFARVGCCDPARDVASEVVAFAQEHNTDLVVTESPSPRFDAICEEIKHSVPVEVLAVEPLSTTAISISNALSPVAQRHLFG